VLLDHVARASSASSSTPRFTEPLPQPVPSSQVSRTWRLSFDMSAQVQLIAFQAVTSAGALGITGSGFMSLTELIVTRTAGVQRFCESIQASTRTWQFVIAWLLFGVRRMSWRRMKTSLIVTLVVVVVWPLLLVVVPGVGISSWRSKSSQVWASLVVD